MRCSLVVFARAAAPGTVKTRLCPPLDPRQAAAVQAAMTAAVLRRLEQASVFARRVIAVTRDPRLGDRIPPPWIDVGQGGGTLGERLQRAACAEFSRGMDCVVLSGSDSPDLPLDRVDGAREQLAAADVSLCPAADGGYCLIGVRPSAVNVVFSGIEWGSAQVAAQTRRRAAAAGLSVFETAPWDDVDRPEDLVRLIGRLEQTRDPALRELHRALLSAKLPRELLPGRMPT